MPPKKEVSAGKILGSVAIVVFVIIVIFNFADSSTSSNSQATTDNAQSSTQNQSPSLVLKSLRVYRDELGDACITGNVINTSTQELNFIEANIAFNDKSGDLVESQNTYLASENLAPGENSTFQICGDTNSAVVLSQTTMNFTGQIGDNTDDNQLVVDNEAKTVVSTTTPQNPLNQQIKQVQNQIQELQQQQSAAASASDNTPAAPQQTWHTVYTVSDDFNESTMVAEGPFTLEGLQTRVTLSCALTYGASTGALVASIYVPHTNANFPTSVHCPADGAQSIISDIPPGQYSLMLDQITNGQGSGNLQSYTVTIEDYY